MLTVVDYERIRKAHHLDGKSLRQISRELGHGYWTIRKALDSAEPAPYTLAAARKAPLLDPYKTEIDKMLKEEATRPRKHRYTANIIFKQIKAQGYRGSVSNLRRYVGRRRRELNPKRPKVFIPLVFHPGQDAQVDWGEASVIMDGTQCIVQLFVMRLCYSRRLFVMAFPNQRQEAFFTAHAAAFDFFGGVPQTITYDNLKTAVKQIFKGRNRKEQDRFIQLRSHYLFDSRFCNPGQGHEKGGVEHSVKYVRQNCLTPLAEVTDFGDLNKQLRQFCLDEDKRQVARQTETIGAQFAHEKPHLSPLPATPFACYTSREVVLNRYCQVTFETNRYSVPTQKAQKQLTLRAHPFRIEIWHEQTQLASHLRCYEREQDILDPRHYLYLLAQRPGAFEHAAPLQQWRSTWPPLYETLLQHLRTQQSPNLAVREFVHILQLHETHAADVVAAAIEQAVADKIAHHAGVVFCLNRLSDVTPVVVPLAAPKHLPKLDASPVPANRYDQLLPQVTA